MPSEKTAFVLHPSDLAAYKDALRDLKPGKEYRDELLIKLMEWIQPFKSKNFTGLSLDGKNSVDAALFMVPFLPEMKDTSLMEVHRKIDQVLGQAADEGCTVAAMAAFTSIAIQGMEEELSKKHGIRITSGNATTAAIIARSVVEICSRFKIKLAKSTLTIVGGSGDIGLGCFLHFADKVDKLYVTSRSMQTLQAAIHPFLGFFDTDIELTLDNNKAIQKSNLVIFVTSAYAPIFELKEFSPWTVACDASAPLNVHTGGKLRRDVFLYHGGIASLPCEVDFGFSSGLAKKNHLHGCQAEGILNALFPDMPVSIGRGKITPMRIKRILELLKGLPGVKPAYSIGDHEYTEKELEKIAKGWGKKK